MVDSIRWILVSLESVFVGLPVGRSSSDRQKQQRVTEYSVAMTN